MYKRIIAVLLSAVLALALLGPGVATAGKSFKTKVTIAQGDNSNFHGKVKSRKKACRKGRTVKLLYKGQYDPPGTFHKAGSTKSNKRGKWKVKTTPISQAAYHAKVKKKRLRHHKGVCKAATSSEIIVG